MMSKPDIRKTIDEIFQLYNKRKPTTKFTFESVADIFEIGNEVFMKHGDSDIGKLMNRPETNAPDLLDDEPFSFERTFSIYRELEPDFSDVTPELIRKVFELNSKIAWKKYREKYDKYILNLYPQHPKDEYINYLAAVVYFEKKQYSKAIKCLNLAIAQNGSSSLYAHLKGLCLMFNGELDSARTYYYQALFLRELNHDVLPELKGNKKIYPNHPVEYNTSVSTIKASLRQLDIMEDTFVQEILPLLD